MRKTPLNIAMRAAIQKQLMHHKFATKDTDLAARKYAIADELYATVLGEKYIQLLQSCPPEFFISKSCLGVRINGCYEQLNMSMPRRLPFEWFNNAFEAPAAIAKKWAKWEHDRDELRNQKSEVGGTLTQTLRSFKFVEDLVDAWPEVKPYVPADQKKAAVVALAVPPKTLNKLLNLP